MKKNKGYTLVEIIAAIVILALLILIAVPAINKQLINFRLNYYKKLENSVVSASKDYVTDRRYSKPTKLFHSKVIKVSDLEKEGYIDEVKDYLGKKCDSTDTSYSYVVVVKTGEKQYDYTTCLKCNQDEKIYFQVKIPRLRRYKVRLQKQHQPLYLRFGQYGIFPCRKMLCWHIEPFRCHHNYPPWIF